MTISILLADDHVVVRDGLRMLLESQKDMSVLEEAGDGREAVEKAKTCRPNVAILDVAMPNMSGIEAANRIRIVSPTTRIIMLSMHATTEHLVRSLDAGAEGYVLKESAGREVVQAVREVAAGRRYLSAPIANLLLDEFMRRRAGKPSDDPLSTLSPREMEVLQLVVEGKSSKEIGKAIRISVKTVGTYRSRMMHKLGISDMPSLIRFAIDHGIAPAR